MARMDGQTAQGSDLLMMGFDATQSFIVEGSMKKFFQAEIGTMYSTPFNFSEPSGSGNTSSGRGSPALKRPMTGSPRT